MSDILNKGLDFLFISDILNKGLDFLLNSKTRDIWWITIIIMFIMLVIMFILALISRENSPYMILVIIFWILYGAMLILNLIYVISKFLSKGIPKDRGPAIGFIVVSIISIMAFFVLPIISMVCLNSQSSIINVIFILLFMALFVIYLLTFTLKYKICANNIDIFNMFCKIPNEKEQKEQKEQKEKEEKEMGRNFINKVKRKN